jgi:hypothetical protein
MRVHLLALALMLIALSACNYNGPNLRDCKDWSTNPPAGCGEPDS